MCVSLVIGLAVLGVATSVVIGDDGGRWVWLLLVMEEMDVVAVEMDGCGYQ